MSQRRLHVLNDIRNSHLSCRRTYNNVSTKNQESKALVTIQHRMKLYEGPACTSAGAPRYRGGGLEVALERGDAGPRDENPPSWGSCTVVGQRAGSTLSNSKSACAAPASALTDDGPDKGADTRLGPVCVGIGGEDATALTTSEGAGGLDGLVAGCGAVCGATQLRVNQRPPPMPLISRCMMDHLRAGPRLGSMGWVGA